MKLRARFSVMGFVKPQPLIPFFWKGRHYSFETRNDKLVAILVEISVPDRNNWPKIELNPSPGVAANIDVGGSPELSFIALELRIFEGLMSLYGIHRIETKRPEIEWLPESEEEHSALGLYSIRESFQDPEAHELAPLPREILMRGIIASFDALEAEIPLGFFRRARVALWEGRYIDAIYDAYFMLEHLYGEGQSRRAQIVKAFQASDELCQAIGEVLRNPPRRIHAEPRLKRDFLLKYAGMPPGKYIAHLVGLRGFLHHHSRKRKRHWDPSMPELYELDAMILYGVAVNIALKLEIPLLYTEDVTRQYAEVVAEAYRNANDAPA